MKTVYFSIAIQNEICPVSWGCWIHWLHQTKPKLNLHVTLFTKLNFEKATWIMNEIRNTYYINLGFYRLSYLTAYKTNYLL